MSTSTRTAPPTIPPHQLAPTTEQLRNAAFFVQNQWYSRQYPKPTFPARPEDARDGVVKTLRSCAWSRSGKHIAVGKEFKEIKVFEASKVPLDPKSAVALSMQPHNGHISALAFSPVEEDILVSGCRSASSGGKVVIWNVTRPQDPIATFTLGDIMSISFHPSGRQFLASHSRSGRDEVASFHLVQDGEAEVWKERDDITLTSRSGTPYDEMNGIQFINSGKAICGVSNDGTFSAWKFPLDPIPLSPEHVVLSLDEEMDDDEADEASRKSTPRDASPEPDNIDEPEEGTEDTSAAQATAADEAAGEDPKGIKNTAPDTGDETNVEDHDGEFIKADVEADEKGDEKGGVKNVDEDGEVPAEKADRDETANDPAVEDATGLDPVGSVEVIEAEEGDVSANEPTENAGPSVILTAPADADIEMAEDNKDNAEEADAPAPDAEAGVSETKAEAEPAQPEAHGDVDMADPAIETAVPSVAPSRHPSPPPEKSKKRKLEVPKTKAKQLPHVRRTMCSAASLQAVGLDPTGRYVAVAGFDSVVRLLDTRNWICQRTFNQSLGGIKQLSFSHDGELLAFGGDDQSVYIVSVVSGELVVKYDSRAVINNLHWHPTKNWLAWTTSNKGTANLTAPLFIARAE